MTPHPTSMFALGTAQLGMSYGIANETGKPSLARATELVHAAWREGIRTFDTAQGYGDSELVLAQTFATLRHREPPRVITKIGAKAIAENGVLASIRHSLARLRQPRVWGVMLHDEESLDQWRASIGPEMERARTEGLIEHAGVSVYCRERAEQALCLPGVQLLQVATNVFDRRIQAAARQIGAAGRYVFVRSVFLQGIVGAADDSPALHVPHARHAAQTLRDFCRRQGFDVREFAIAYIRRRLPNAQIVLGAETPEQLTANCGLYRGAVCPDAVCDAWDRAWPSDFEDLVDPRRWKRKS